MGAAGLEPLSFGRYPTAVHRIAALSAPGCDLWVKRDDLTHDVYGGNKVRKLEYLLASARASGATRLVTVGAAGSHHVLATTYFGKLAGLTVEAVLVPQPPTAHAVTILRASLALGLKPFPVRSWPAAVVRLGQRVASGATYVPLGGSNLVGTLGYVSAARELASQVRDGTTPEPDVCVVALGSAGTAAGLAAGFAALRMKTRVVGVCVASPPRLISMLARRLGEASLRRASQPGEVTPPLRLAVDSRFLGAGYGHATVEGDEATRDAERGAGLALDPTYTAKAFACALWHVRARRAPRVLYWHTLSSAPIEPLAKGADGPTLEVCMRALFGMSALS